MLCEQTGTQYSVLLAAAEQHHRTMTLIASEAARNIILEGPAGVGVEGGVSVSPLADTDAGATDVVAKSAEPTQVADVAVTMPQDPAKADVVG